MSNKKILKKIITVRDQQGVLDRDLASLYGLETKRFMERVQRNKEKFKKDSFFQIEKDEFATLSNKIATFNSSKSLPKYLPFFFTKKGIEVLTEIYKKEDVREINKVLIMAMDANTHLSDTTYIELKNSVETFKNDDYDVSIAVDIYSESVWLTQEKIAELYGTTQQNISFHLQNIFQEKELEKNSVHKYYLYTAKDGKTYKYDSYNLDAILSVGYRVKSKVATLFRQWANKVLKAYLQQKPNADFNTLGHEIVALKEEISSLKENQRDILDNLPIKPDLLGNLDFFKLISKTANAEPTPNIANCFIYCEGKTDIAYIQKALSLFGGARLIDENLVKFIDSEGEQNQKKILYAYKHESGPTLEENSVFVFDCDTGVLSETVKNVVCFSFPRNTKEAGYFCSRGIENNFHINTLKRIFDEKHKCVRFIKKFSNTDSGIQETIVSIDLDKEPLCKLLCESGTKEDFLPFRGLVSLILELSSVSQELTTK